MPRSFLPWLGALLLFGACGPAAEVPPAQPPANTNASQGCMGGKCDIPTDDEDYSWEQVCTERRADVLEGNRESFSRDFIRWSCADVDGVSARNSDDRGQEYCEYFALVQLPDLDADELSGAVLDLGRINGEDTSGARPRPTTTPLELELSDDQFDWYDDHGDEVVGQCIFTSWHEDFPELACEASGDCPEVLGDVAVSAQTFRMQVGINSNNAARELLRDCIKAPAQGTYTTGESDATLDDDFMRGCRLADDLYQTAWRFSDSSICAAGVRLAECGCGVEGATDIDAAVAQLIPSPQEQQEAGALSLRGFPLGGWAGLDALPSGCSYIETQDSLRTLVACDIYAFDLIDHLKDPKGFCRKTYGENVVVHVPLPADKIACEAPAEGRYSQCSETPWVVTAN